MDFEFSESKTRTSVLKSVETGGLFRFEGDPDRFYIKGDEDDAGERICMEIDGCLYRFDQAEKVIPVSAKVVIEGSGRGS